MRIRTIQIAEKLRYDIPASSLAGARVFRIASVLLTGLSLSTCIATRGNGPTIPAAAIDQREPSRQQVEHHQRTKSTEDERHHEERDVSRRITLAGVTAEEVQLDTPLRTLDEQTEPFRRRTIFNEREERYTTDVVAPGVTFLVTLDSTQKRLDLVFPSESGGDPTGTSANLTDFADAVRRATGRELNGRDLGIRLVLERGTFTYEGRETPYTTAYILPEDRQSGQLVGRQGVDGPFLAHGESYYNHGSSGGLVWLRDPPQ